MKPEFQVESWEQDGPSYIQAYVVSAFLLVGILSIATHQVPATPLALVFTSVWFGVFLLWLWQNRHAERTFSSNRITIADDRMIHSFRYAVTEATHVELDISDVTEIVIHKGKPIFIEIHSSQTVEYINLPNEEVSDRFVNTLLRRNPDIKIGR